MGCGLRRTHAMSGRGGRREREGMGLREGMEGMEAEVEEE